MVWEQAHVSPSSFPQPRAGFCCIGLSEIGDTQTIAIYGENNDKPHDFSGFSPEFSNPHGQVPTAIQAGGDWRCCIGGLWAMEENHRDLSTRNFAKILDFFETYSEDF